MLSTMFRHISKSVGSIYANDTFWILEERGHGICVLRATPTQITKRYGSSIADLGLLDP